MQLALSDKRLVRGDQACTGSDRERGEEITEMTPINGCTESSLPLVYRFVNAGPKHGQRNGEPIQQWGPVAAQRYRNALGR